MSAIPIFVGGTGSHVGKSWVVTAICRYLYRRGLRVAPFKAQNMSNNSAVCLDGGEIGRAQAAQAEACGLEPHSDLNPILMKPTGVFGSQVVLNGKVWMNLTAREYYRHFDFLLSRVLSSYHRLARQYDYIVIEGAGSITELNLKHYDLVNLGLASRIGARSILVSDIDRGGVFSSITGTFGLLESDESSLVRSFLVNRFRGDPDLFQEGVRILEERTGKPCLGVFPYLPDLNLDEEDTLCLEDEKSLSAEVDEVTASPRVAIVRFPHISNFTDFRLLPQATYVTQPVAQEFDTIILPGTKSTINDLLWFRSTGMEAWLLEQLQRGSRVIGICGGYQMLGEDILDQHHVESPVRSVRGIGLIPARTRMMPEKITRRVVARTPSGIDFPAYEIHMGVTTISRPFKPFALIEDGIADGIRLPNIVGTCLHGALESVEVLEELLECKLPRIQTISKDLQYDRLAEWFESHANLEVFETEYLDGGKSMGTTND